MGTPQFAVPTLEALLESRHNVCAVVTNPDKRAGRSLKLAFSAVKIAAQKAGLTILQPDDLKDPILIDSLNETSPDACVVVAFRILPLEIISVPLHGCINLHPSLLPDLRGAAPINWALMRGYNKTGITTFLIEKKVDTGQILLQETVNIDSEENAGILSDRLSVLGADLIVKTLDLLEKDLLIPRSQIGEATRAPKIKPETCQIDWTCPAIEIHNQVRGLSPAPCAFTMLNGKRLKLYKTRLIGDTHDSEPGTVFGFVDNALAIKTGSGLIGMVDLQLEGKRRMTAIEFQRGKAIQPGTKLG